MKYPFNKTWWVNQGEILAGCYPGHPDPSIHQDMIESLMGLGITDFINLQEPGEAAGGKSFRDYLPAAQAYARDRGTELGFHRLPIPDQQVPDLNLLAACLDQIDLILADEGKPYVHCWGGNGRTGTVIGCWLVRHGRSPEEAVQEMAEGRDGRKFRFPAPENAKQRDFINAWATNDPMLND